MELIESIKDTIGKRVNSAFSGTFILVWIGFNWRLIFALFYFDKGFNFSAKIEWIENYFKTHDKYDTLICPILITFASYITYQLFNTITYAIGTFVNLQLKPRVLSLIKKDMMYSKDDYLKLNKLHIELTKTSQDNQDKLINSETDKKIIQTENEELNKKIIELNNFVVSQKQIIDTSTKKQTDVMNRAIADWNTAKELLQKDYLELSETLRKTKENTLLFIETKNSFAGIWEITTGIKEDNQTHKTLKGHFNNLQNSSGGVFTNAGIDVFANVKILEYENSVSKLVYTEIATNASKTFYFFKQANNLYQGISEGNLEISNRSYFITLRNIQQ